MAKTIEEGFNMFHSWLTPTKTESDKAKAHRASIETCLKDNFGMRRFFRSGSFGNGTSISSYSDVDYFASIPTENLKQISDSTLNQIKNVLDSRFPNTDVHVDSPAVVVPFGDNDSETTEIVPADFIEKDKYDCRTYEIPNGAGGWMRSSPDSSKLNIDVLDDKLNNKLKPLIRFVKAWKYYNSVPISSFYLETFIGIYIETEKSVFYSIDIRNIFFKLQSSKLAEINDPMGVSGSISAYKNTDEYNKIIKALEDAVRRSTQARTAEKENRISDAFYWWNKVYSDLFPSY